MKRTYLLLTVMTLAIFLTACGIIEPEFFDCDGFFITPITEDLGDVSSAPFDTPFTLTVRVEDSVGNVIYNGTLLTISSDGILTTNGGFKTYSQRPERAQPISIYISASEEIGEELLGELFVDCTGEPVERPIIYFSDDRIGPDTATTLNAFRRDNNLVIYSLENGSFILPLEAIDALGNPTSNTLVVSNNGVDVYLLSDGLIQIMEVAAPDGKRDILIIDLDDAGLVRRWRRGTFNTLTGETNIHSQTDGWDGYPSNF